MRFDAVRALAGGLIVSCQALPGEPLHGPHHMAAMARAAEEGGACGIRANGPDDIAAIRTVTRLPIIGIWKVETPGYPVFITPGWAEAKAVAGAGADIIALDATQRPRASGEKVADLIQRIHKDLGLPVMADVSTVQEAKEAEAAGADLIATTLAGYTEETKHQQGPAFDLLEKLVQSLRVPVVMEGRIWTPEEAARALELGAYAVVVGTAITRPQVITRRFVEAMATSARTSRVKRGHTDASAVPE